MNYEKEMRHCNICKKRKKDSKFKHEGKKTCIRCEFRWKRSFLRLLVQDRRLSAKERLANRLGYFGTAFIMMSPYLLPYGNVGAITYVVGGIVCIPQVWVAKQWNLVVINLNVIIGYGIYLFN
tara:strand:+ start:2261 stop:2629 length:369 start_codon:yes stop_codon:yes gene_type:complete